MSGATEADNQLTAPGTGQFRAGRFDDPFFFDFQGFQDTLSGTPPGFTGTDAFAGADVSAIVLEIDSVDFLGTPGNTNVGVQVVTELNGVQFDRMGRPAISTALIVDTPGDPSRKDEFNARRPSRRLR